MSEEAPGPAVTSALGGLVGCFIRYLQDGFAQCLHAKVTSIYLSIAMTDECVNVILNLSSEVLTLLWVS